LIYRKTYNILKKIIKGVIMLYKNKYTNWKKYMCTAAIVATVPINTFAQTTVNSSRSGGNAGPPNIVVIFGDDIGQSNISAYTFGLMGYRTPNIDRIAKEGMMFTDYYAEQSSTAGRSAFITGQTPFRTGLSKVGTPGSDIGLQPEDVTIATVLKSRGYNTAQFGKNHLGDRDEFLPTNHGFDEFYGNLYHLNAEEEPEHPNYPVSQEFRELFMPRGVIHSFADGRVIDTGPLDRKRMETIDDDIAQRSAQFIDESTKAGKPFFVWVNFTHMHFRTYAKPESVGQAGPHLGIYADVMIDHDRNVGLILDKLDELGITENTIVIYTTDNGPHLNSWPDAAATPFRGEKNTNWEGGYRVPAMVRWPGRIEAGSISNEIVSHLDWFPTLIAAAGDSGIKEKLMQGNRIGSRNYKVHLDGYNILPYLTGIEPKSPRLSFFYFNDDAQLVAIRYGNYKFVFMEQRLPGTMAVWAEPFVSLRIPKLFNLRLDPYEMADITSNTYWDWLVSNVFLIGGAMEVVEHHLLTYLHFPPRQKADTYTIDQVIQKLHEALLNIQSR
jgi:arylsulfatase